MLHSYPISEDGSIDVPSSSAVVESPPASHSFKEREPTTCASTFEVAKSQVNTSPHRTNSYIDSVSSSYRSQDYFGNLPFPPGHTTGMFLSYNKNQPLDSFYGGNLFPPRISHMGHYPLVISRGPHCNKCHGFQLHSPFQPLRDTYSS